MSLFRKINLLFGKGKNWEECSICGLLKNKLFLFLKLNFSVKTCFPVFCFTFLSKKIVLFFDRKIFCSYKFYLGFLIWNGSFYFDVSFFIIFYSVRISGIKLKVYFMCLSKFD